MRFSKLFLGILFALIWESQCFGYGSIACVNDDPSIRRCYGSADLTTVERADLAALNYCEQNNSGKTCQTLARVEAECAAIVTPYPSALFRHYVGRGTTPQIAVTNGQNQCKASFASCEATIATCDGGSPSREQIQSQSQPTLQPSDKGRKGTPSDLHIKDGKTGSDEVDFGFLRDPAFWELLRLAKLYENIIRGIGLGLGFLIVLLIYAKRAAIANFVIHGNLPYTIENRSDDIEVLFTRSQRLNWNGRVIFGLTAQLGMTEQQLLLVRRYRLGRVIAFDSLRRQRQNELARLHLQQVAQTEAHTKDDKPLSQLLAALRMAFLMLFWFFRALFSFLFGFLFLRVTIAKLVRGKLIESIELPLLMEAKAAIEQTAINLKEYLLLAETFDGREEVYEPPA